MANEITINENVKISKGNFTYTYNPGQQQYDLTTARRGGHCQTIGTSAELLSFGDVASPSLCVLRNLDATNFVRVGPQIGTTGTFQSMCKLSPGRSMRVWLDPAATLMAQADTASIDLQVDVMEA